jgi:hypothetical protein
LREKLKYVVIFVMMMMGILPLNALQPPILWVSWNNRRIIKETISYSEVPPEEGSPEAAPRLKSVRGIYPTVKRS